MPYRTDREALELRRAALQGELEDLLRQREALAGVEQELADVKQRLAHTEQMLASQKPRKSLLDDVRVASPCHAAWNEMAGDDRVRFCGHCAKNVFNLSAMAAPEAEQLLRESAERDICIRLHRRDDGTILTADCPVGAKKKRIRRLALATVGGGLMAGAGILAMAREEHVGQVAVSPHFPMPTQTAQPPKPEPSTPPSDSSHVTMGIRRQVPPSAPPGVVPSKGPNR